MVASSSQENSILLESRNGEYSTLNQEEFKSLTSSAIDIEKTKSSTAPKQQSAKESIRRKLTARVSPMTRDNGDNFEKELKEDTIKKIKSSKNKLESWKPNTITTDGRPITTPSITIKKEYVEASPCQRNRSHLSNSKHKSCDVKVEDDHQPQQKFRKLLPALSTSNSTFTAASNPPFLPPLFASDQKSFGANMPMMSLLTASQGHLATLQDEDGDTPLHIAIAQCQVPLVQYLIQMTLASGISLDIYNKLKQTPLHLAVITNQPSIIRILISAGVDANIPDRNGQTAVHLACQRSSIECLMELINCRHPINFVAKNYNGLTPLHEAVMSNSQEIIHFLVACGADIDSKDGKSGRTPLHYAVEIEHMAIIQLLINSGANVNAASFAGSTPIQAASGRGMHEVTRLLLGSINEAACRNTSSTSTSNHKIKGSIKKMT